MTPESELGMGNKPKGARRWRRVAGWSAAVVAVAIGALHLPIAMRFLAQFGGCPFAGAQLTPAQMETARHWAVASRKGEDVAPARPALGFTLDVTSEKDVHRWAIGAGVHCEDIRAALVVCKNVPPQAVGRPAGDAPVDELALGFNLRGQLVNVTTMRAHLGAREASSVSNGIASGLRAALGPATHSAGSMAAASLGAPGALGMATLSYRFGDYLAEVAAMNLPSSGLSVREHYLSARD